MFLSYPRIGNIIKYVVAFYTTRRCRFNRTQSFRRETFFYFFFSVYFRNLSVNFLLVIFLILCGPLQEKKNISITRSYPRPPPPGNSSEIKTISEPSSVLNKQHHCPSPLQRVRRRFFTAQTFFRSTSRVCDRFKIQM